MVNTEQNLSSGTAGSEKADAQSPTQPKQDPKTEVQAAQPSSEQITTTKPTVTIMQSGDTLIKSLKTQSKGHIETLWASGYFGKSSNNVDWNKVAISVAKFNSHGAGADNVKIGQSFTLPDIPSTSTNLNLNIPAISTAEPLKNPQDSAKQLIGTLEHNAQAGNTQEVAQLASQALEIGGPRTQQTLSKIAKQYYKSFGVAAKNGELEQAEKDLQMARAIDPNDKKLKYAELQFTWKALSRHVNEGDYQTSEVLARRVIDLADGAEGKKTTHYAESARKFLTAYGASNAIRSELEKAQALEAKAAANQDPDLWRKAEAKYESAIRLGSANGIRNYKPWLGIAHVRATGEGLEPPRPNIQKPGRRLSGTLDYTEGDRVKGPLLKAMGLLPKSDAAGWKQLVDVNIKSGLYPEVSNGLTSAIDFANRHGRSQTAGRLSDIASQLASAYLDRIPSLPSVKEQNTQDGSRVLTQEEALSQVQKLARYGGPSVINRLADTYDSMGDPSSAESLRNAAKESVL